MIEVTKKIDITNLLQIYFNSQEQDRESYELWWANHDDAWDDEDYGWSKYDNGTNWWDEYETFKKKKSKTSKSDKLVWDKQSQKFVNVNQSEKKPKVKKQKGAYKDWDDYLTETQKMGWDVDNSSLFDGLYDTTDSDDGMESTRGHKNENKKKLIVSDKMYHEYKDIVYFPNPNKSLLSTKFSSLKELDVFLDAHNINVPHETLEKLLHSLTTIYCASKFDEKTHMNNLYASETAADIVLKIHTKS